MEVTLQNGIKYLIDDEDYLKVGHYAWQLVGAGYLARSSGSKDKCKHFYLHKEILNCPEGYEIDHINENKLDNRKCNLRVCTRAENCRKRPKLKRTKHKLSSIYKGVSSYKSKWRARIFVNKKEIHLGIFEFEIDAARAYDEAALTYFGDYANINRA